MEEENGSNALTVVDTLTVRVKDQTDNTVLFKMKKDAQMKKIFGAYAQQIGAQPNNLKFVYDGQRVKETDTPKMLEMEDNDEIQAVLEQTGG